MSYTTDLAPSRSLTERGHRPKQGATTYYTVPGLTSSAAVNGTQVLVQNTDIYSPWFTAVPIVIDQLAIEVTTLQAAKSTRIGLYAADASLQPTGKPLADSGDISVATTGVKTYTPGTPIYVPRGWYLSVFNTDSTTTAACRYLGGGVAMIDSALGTGLILTRLQASRAYAAFPTPGTAWTVTTSDSATSGRHVIFYRVSAA